MSKRAAIYARVSKAYKVDDSRVTIEAQLKDCEAYCDKRGYKIVGRFVDKDKYRARKKLVNPSGTRKDRPAYLSVLKAATAGEIDVICAWKEDRLYRGMYAALPLSEALDESRGTLTVELVTESFDPKMLGIKAAIAKLELDNIRERMLMGRRMRLERGEIPGGAIRYGYAKGENNHAVIDEAEAAVVRQVFEWYIKGENNMEIRRRLNALDIAPRVSKVWSKATINNILTFKGYATGEYTTSLDGEPFVIPCPPIISMETWGKALETRKENTFYRARNVKEDYLCRGLIVCPCGWKWLARTNSGSGGKSGHYGCSRYGHQPEQVHPNCPGSIGSKKLDDFVWSFVTNICHHPAIIQDAIDAKIDALQEEHEAASQEAEELQHRLDDIQTERQWVITQARKGRITEDDMDLQLGALHFQELDLRKKHNDKLAALAARSQAEELKAWANGYLREIEAGLEVLETDPEKLSASSRANLYDGLEAERFLEKFEGDELAALNWAILEEKRRLVRMLIESIQVVKGKRGKKMIIPMMYLELPVEYASLLYDHESLKYIESWRKEPAGV